MCCVPVRVPSETGIWEQEHNRLGFGAGRKCSTLTARAARSPGRNARAVTTGKRGKVGDGDRMLDGEDTTWLDALCYDLFFSRGDMAAAPSRQPLNMMAEAGK